MINVITFGAVGDGITDDRAAVQAAINAAQAGSDKEVYFPLGKYLINKAIHGLYCLLVPEGITLTGDGPSRSIIIQADVDANVKLLHINGADVTVENMAITAAPQTILEEHKAGIFATSAPNLTLFNLDVYGFAGDGVYIHIGSHNCNIQNCYIYGNYRNGITFGGGTDGGTVLECEVCDNFVQQIDSEPGPGFTANNVSIHKCKLAGYPTSGDYVVTVSGSGTNWQSSGWRIRDCEIDGSIHTVWAKNVEIHNCYGTNYTNKANVDVYRNCSNIYIHDNSFSTNNSKAVISVKGTGANQLPTEIIVSRNHLTTKFIASYGVEIRSALTVYVLDNTIIGAGFPDPSSSGVYVRATIAGLPVENIIVRNNLIQNFGNAGVTSAGNPGVVSHIHVGDNIYKGFAPLNTFISSDTVTVTGGDAVTIP